MASTTEHCVSCGLPAAQWRDSEGVATTRGTHCCDACASGRQCDCAERAMTKDEIRDDAASGDFVQSLQHDRKTVPEGPNSDALTSPPVGDYSRD